MTQEIYRAAASVVLLRSFGAPSRDGSGMSYQILLLHKPRKRDAWQLPQGGVEEGETMEQAALRELAEEAGVTQCALFGRSTEVYQYDFPPSYRRFRPDNVCGQRIEYVFAFAPGNTDITVDAQEVDRYVWVFQEQVRLYIKRKEYLELVQRLFEECVRRVDRSLRS